MYFLLTVLVSESLSFFFWKTTRRAKMLTTWVKTYHVQGTFLIFSFLWPSSWRNSFLLCVAQHPHAGRMKINTNEETKEEK